MNVEPSSAQIGWNPESERGHLETELKRVDKIFIFTRRLPLSTIRTNDGENTVHVFMAKKRTGPACSVRRWIAFIGGRKLASSLSTRKFEQTINYIFLERKLKTSSVGGKFPKKPQLAEAVTNQTVQIEKKWKYYINPIANQVCFQKSSTKKQTRGPMKTRNI